jgi:hypothetical protein
MNTRGSVAIGFFLSVACATIFTIGVPLASADTVSTESFTGTLASSSSIFETTLTLTAGDDVLLQTYGFGGGMNGSGATIAPGGTDPFVAIFSGTGDSASILTDGMGNPYGTSADLGNYSSFVGCPPAGTVDFGGPTCGDITMSLSSLAAGTYSVVLSDGQYIAGAVFDNGTLGEGFADLTGGVFCNIENNGVSCPDSLGGAYALDITTTSTASSVPEPGMFGLLASGLLGVTLVRLKRS